MTGTEWGVKIRFEQNCLYFRDTLYFSLHLNFDSFCHHTKVQSVITCNIRTIKQGTEIGYQLRKQTVDLRGSWGVESYSIASYWENKILLQHSLVKGISLNTQQSMWQAADLVQNTWQAAAWVQNKTRDRQQPGYTKENTRPWVSSPACGRIL
jgi:hypothetical protein